MLIQGYRKTEEDLLQFLRDNYKHVVATIHLKPKNEQAVCYATLKDKKKQSVRKLIIESKKGLQLTEFKYKVIIQFDVGKIRMVLFERTYELEYDILQEERRTFWESILKKPASYKKIPVEPYGYHRAKFYRPQKVIDKDINVEAFMNDFMKLDSWIEEIIIEVVKEDALEIYQKQLESEEGMILKPMLEHYDIDTKFIFRHKLLKK